MISSIKINGNILSIFILVKNWTRIFPILFLMIYAVILFHNSVPHIHGEVDIASDTHPGEQDDHVHHVHHSHHSAQHHHHDDSKDESSFLSLLLDALGDHHNALEIDHFDDEISLKSNSTTGFEMASAEDDVDYPIFQVAFHLNYSSNQEKSIFESPPLLYEHSNSRSTTLRGPPQLS
ncbi:MAG: hypothetical protein ACI865_002425 [Flavobacteriaceae bacterium]